MGELMLANLPFGIVVALCVLVASNHVRIKELEKWKKGIFKRMDEDRGGL